MNNKLLTSIPSHSKKRLEELSTITQTSLYNQVYHIQKPDYARDVTDASSKAFVAVLLTSSQGTNTESRILIEMWRELARKFGDVKFCQIRADLCIEGYPDRNTPTVLVYRDGDIKRQIVTLRELGGVRTKAEDIEKVLVDVGAVRLGDPRLQQRDERSAEAESSYSSIRGGKRDTISKNGNDDNNDDDSDWD
jgi:hypothetical protein